MSATDANRPFQIKTVLGGALVLASFEGTDAVSRPFLYRLELLAEDAVDVAALLHTKATLSIRTERVERHVNGIIRTVRTLPLAEDGMFAYEADLVSAFALLDLHTDSRIFADQTTKEIIREILGQHSIEHEFRLQAESRRRQYCAQYRETDFDFVSRLLEEEGMHYYFEHTASNHVMVLSDQRPTRACTAAAYRAGAVTAPGVSGSVFEIVIRRQVHARTVELGDYNFETPRLTLASEVPTSQPDGSRGCFRDNPGRFRDMHEAGRCASIRMEEIESGAELITGKTTSLRFESGAVVELRAYPVSGYERLTLLSVKQSGRNPGYQGNAESRGGTFECEFEAIRNRVRYRPPRVTRKAIVRGTQPALVLGTEDINTDEFGRVPVHFFWDRNGVEVWTRVAQQWAGQGHGTFFIPRKGDEVMVAFLEGDPDRPVVIGSVYNGANEWRYRLPGEKTKSGIHTRSSPSGGYNEIVFEDRQGSEQIIIHAQRDENVTVGNDETLRVGHNRTVSIVANDSVSVGASRSASVGNDDTCKVGTNFSVTAGSEISFNAPGGSITIGKTGITIQSPGTVVIRGSTVLIN